MSVDLASRYFWMIHLSPVAPRCAVAIDHANRNVARSWSLEGGMKALLSRCEIGPDSVSWTLERADPVLRRNTDNAPLADIWAGPSFEDLCEALNHLRITKWHPAFPQTQLQGAA